MTKASCSWYMCCGSDLLGSIDSAIECAGMTCRVGHMRALSEVSEIMGRRSDHSKTAYSYSFPYLI